MEAHSEKKCAPIYRPEFRELRALPMPNTIRYQPRAEPAIGMFDTTRPPPLKSNGTSHVLSKAQIEQAKESRAGTKVRPHSIATRSISAMRERKGAWISTRELVELANRHMPEHCVPATMANIYEALNVWRKKGTIESRPIERGSQTLEWRVAP